MRDVSEIQRLAVKYPNIARLDEHAAQILAISDFFDWLDAGRPDRNRERRGERYFLAQHARYSEGSPRREPSAVCETLQQLIHQFIGVDDIALERERRAILDELRAAQGATP